MFFSGGTLNTIRGNYSTQASYDVYALDSFGGAVPPNPMVLDSNLPAAATWATFAFDDTLSEPTTGPNAKNRTKQFNLTDVLVKQVGQHSLKFGGDFRELYLNGKVNRFQVFYFPGLVQDFLTTGTASFLRTQTFNPGRVRSDALSLFAQDSWKLTRRLSLTYGLRWELDPAPAALSGTTLAAWTNVIQFTIYEKLPSGPADLGPARRCGSESVANVSAAKPDKLTRPIRVNTAHLPTPDYGVKDRMHVRAELAAPAEGKIVGAGEGQAVTRVI